MRTLIWSKIWQSVLSYVLPSKIVKFFRLSSLSKSPKMSLVREMLLFLMSMNLILFEALIHLSRVENSSEVIDTFLSMRLLIFSICLGKQLGFTWVSSIWMSVRLYVFSSISKVFRFSSLSKSQKISLLTGVCSIRICARFGAERKKSGWSLTRLFLFPIRQDQF